MNTDPADDRRRVAELEAEVRRLKADRNRLIRELAALRVSLGMLPFRAANDAHAL